MDFELLFDYAISIAVAIFAGFFILIFFFGVARFVGFIEKVLEEIMASIKKAYPPLIYYSAWLVLFFLVGWIVFNLD